MKKITWAFILLVVYTKCLAQATTPKDIAVANKCRCEDIVKQPPIDERDMFSKASEARKFVKIFKSFFPDFKKDIKVMVVTCLSKGNPARALVCGETLYILYDNENLTKEKDSWFDKFVLAHELGHHIRGHFHDGSSYNARTNDFEEYNKKNFKFYNNNIIEELQADELAIYAIKKMGGNLAEISRVIEERGEVATNIHPSGKERKQFAEAVWKKVNINRKFDDQSYKDFATDFHIKYNKMVYGFTFEVLAGWVMSNPKFSKNDESINANLISTASKPTFKAGLRFSYIDIKFPVRPEIEINYLSHHYITFDGSSALKGEAFSFQHLNVIPQVTFNSLSLSKKSMSIPQWGVIASVGYSFNVPIYYKYDNYYTNTSLTGRENIKSTGNFTMALGIERKPLREKVIKYFRLSGRYSPMPLGIISNNVNDKLVTKSGLIDVNLSFRLWN